MEIGIYTFVENTPLPGDGKKISPTERIANLIEEIELADQTGLDLFGIGEHHREEYLSSSPAILLAAAAARTEQIRLSSAVTVLGSDDPVRIFQQFATVDLISGGRAEIMVGRGSFIESFPLFGYDLQEYDELFEEKLELLLRLNGSERITWSGDHRPAIDNRGIWPRPHRTPLPVWVAVGGTPRSAVRTGALGLPMALAIIGGETSRFTAFADLHRKAAAEAGKPRPELSINVHGLIGDESKRAADEAYPAFALTMNKIGRERGWPPFSRHQFDHSLGLDGANFVGSPQQIIDKILYQHALFGHQRFLMQMSVGSLPHDTVLRSIELLGSVVAPAVRRETVAADRSSSS